MRWALAACLCACGARPPAGGSPAVAATSSTQPAPIDAAVVRLADDAAPPFPCGDHPCTANQYCVTSFAAGQVSPVAPKEGERRPAPEPVVLSISCSDRIPNGECHVLDRQVRCEKYLPPLRSRHDQLMQHRLFIRTELDPSEALFVTF